MSANCMGEWKNHHNGKNAKKSCWGRGKEKEIEDQRSE